MPPRSLATKQTTKEKGDAFRDLVRDLCIAAGYKPITERYVDGKKSDVFFEVFGQPRKRRVAIEAKHYDENLKKSKVSEIIGDYRPALQNRSVDEVWVISKNGFTSEAAHAIELVPQFFAMSYHFFLSTLIDFPRYLQHLKLEIQNDGILEYYVPQRFFSKGSAFPYVDRWLKTSEAAPLAILSTYGMGKTSLARHLAFRFAEEALNDPLARIPIYIPLNLLSSQQRIDGLLGSLFTSMVALNGYSYPLFQKLNSLGHFILLLDGLDEMRHAMTWDDFQYNFRQLKEVISKQTKAILFGRPNIFRNQREYDETIGGLVYIGRSPIKAASRSGFDAVDLEPFTVSETYTYLRDYMKFLRRNEEASNSDIEKRLQQIKNLGLDELLARPVHAQMLAELASDLRTKLTKLSRFQLYQRFMEFVLRRDFDRSGGNGLTPKRRYQALQKMAWHLWFEVKKQAFQFGEINELLKQKEEDTREVLAGSVIDSKHGDNFYFSHRSFFEFLNAEYILHNAVDWTALEDRISLISDDIIAFVVDSDDNSSLALAYECIERSGSFRGKLLKLAIALYSRLYLDRLATRGKRGIKIAKQLGLREKPRLEPVRLYLHARTLAHRHSTKERTLLLSILDQANSSLVLSRKPLKLGHDYFFSGVVLLLEMLTIKAAALSTRDICQQIIRLMLNWWDVRGAMRYTGDAFKYVVISPKLRKVIFVPHRSPPGIQVIKNEKGIIKIGLNPRELWKDIRRSEHQIIRPDMGTLPGPQPYFKWSELKFVPESTRRGWSPNDFGREVMEFTDRPVSSDEDETLEWEEG